MPTPNDLSPNATLTPQEMVVDAITKAATYMERAATTVKTWRRSLSDEVPKPVMDGLGDVRRLLDGLAYLFEGQISDLATIDVKDVLRQVRSLTDNIEAVIEARRAKP